MADITGHLSLSSEESPATGLTGLFLAIEMISCFGAIWPGAGVYSAYGTGTLH